MTDAWGIPLQAGPCVVCGRTGYPLSMGGPSICPPCDCGPPSPRRIEEMRSEIFALRDEVERLRADRDRLIEGLKELRRNLSKPEKRVHELCLINRFSSRACELGTRGCIVAHELGGYSFGPTEKPVTAGSPHGQPAVEEPNVIRGSDPETV